MANNILITPGSSNIQFSGSNDSDIKLETLADGAVQFTGESGSLLNISDGYSGSLMSVSDVSGVPIFDVNSDDTVTLGQFSSPIKILTNTSGHTTISGSSTSTGSFGKIEGSVTIPSGKALKTSLIRGGSDVEVDTEGAHLTLTSTDIRLANGQQIEWNNANTRILASHASNYMRFDIGGVSNVLYLTNGQVNIGNSSVPNNSAKLGVTGNINVGNGQASSIVYFENSGTDMYIQGNASKLNIGSVGNTQYVSFPAGGAVELHEGSAGSVTARTDADNLVIESSVHSGLSILTPDNQFSNLVFGSPSDNRGAVLDYSHSTKVLNIGSDVASGQVAIKTAAGTEAVRIDASGNVGIGVTSPDQKLDVSAGHILIGNGYYILGRNSSGSQRRLIGFNSGQDMVRINDEGGNTLLGAAGTTVTVGGNLNVAGTITAEQFITEYTTQTIIATSGSTKFGNTSDDTHEFTGSLNVSQSVHNIGGQVYVTKPSDPLVSVSDGTRTMLAGYITSTSGMLGTTTNHPLEIRTNNTARINITNGGNVGIGSTSPAELLNLAAGEPVMRFTDTDNSNYHHLFSSSNLFYISADRNNTGTGALIFRVGGTDERMRINSSGNVGIGTTSPVAQGLTVANAGDVNLTLLADSDANAANNWPMVDFRVDNVSGNPEARIYYKQDITSLVLATNNNNAVVVNSSGNVGIGTTSPEAFLHVSQSSVGSTSVAKFVRPEGSNASNYMVDIINADSTSNQGAGLNIQAGNDSGDTTLNVANRAGTSLLRVRSDGNVGIGTAAPDRLLHLAAASPSIMWEDTDVSGLKHQIIGGGNAGLEISVDINNTTTGYFRVDVGGTEKMRLVETGRLGIGVTAPTAQMEIYGDGTAINQIRLRHNGSGTNGVLDLSVTSTAANIIANYSSTAIPLRFFTGGAERMRISATGDVGIGDPSPSYKLEVNGTLGVQGNATFNNVNVSLYSNSYGSNGLLRIYGTDAVEKFQIGALNSTTAYMYSPANVGQIIYAGGSQNIWHLASGNVGIGHSPSYKLDVNGTGRFTSTLTIGSEILNTNFSSSIAGRVATLSAASSGLSFNGSTTNGLLTYGNSTTADVETNLTFNGTALSVGSGGRFDVTVANAGGTFMTVNHTGNENWSLGAQSGAGSDDYLDIGISGGTRAMSWHETGNVGIGTTSPSFPLSVGNTTNTSRVEIGTSGQTTWQSNVYSVLTVGVSGSHAITQDGSGNSQQWFNVYDTGNKYRAYAGYGANWMYNVSTGTLAYRTTDTTSTAGSQITDLTAKFGIEKDGKVGIGTDNPVEALTIRGTSTGTDGFAYPSIAGYTGTTKLYALEQHFGLEGRLALYDTGNLKVLFRASGSSYINTGSTLNFGIGTASPAYKLDVTGTGRFTTDLTVDNRIAINTTPDAFLSLKTDSDGSNAIIALDHDGNALMRLRDSSAAALLNLYDGGQEKITFDADGTSFFNAGNVGIGTTVAPEALTIGTITGAKNIAVSIYSYFGSTYSGLWTLTGFNAKVDNQGSGTDYVHIANTHGSAGYAYTLHRGYANGITFHTFNGSTTAGTNIYETNERMRITGTGNVGIGTTSPGKLLTLASANAQFMINESDQSSGAQNWLLNAEGGVLYHQTQGGTAGSPSSGNTWLQVARSSTSISSIAFPSSANVGIGSTVPAQALDVVGGGAFTTSVYFNGRVRINHDGQVHWGAAYNQGYLSWDTNEAIFGGLASNALRIQSGGATTALMDTSQNTRFFGNVNVDGTLTAQKIITNVVSQSISFATGSNIFGDSTSDTHTFTGKVGIGAPATDAISLEIGGAVEGSAGLSTHGASATIINKRNEADQHGLVVGAKNSSSYPLIVGRHDTTFNDLVVNGSGNVGIGVIPEATNGLATALQVGGNGYLLSTKAQGASGEMDFGYNFYFAPDGNYKYISTDEASMIRQGSGNIRFRTAPSGTADATATFTERMIITQAGNVGIGTNSPSGQNASGPILHLFGQNTSGTLSEPQIVFQQTGEPAMSIGANANLDSGAAMLFQTNGSNIRMVILEDGKIGIGTTSPDVKFHVMDGSAGTVDSYSGVHFTLEATTNTAMQFLTGANSDSRIWFGDASNTTSGGILYTHNATATSEHMELRVNAATRLTILGSGNVGIGTTSPIRALDIVVASGDPGIRLESAAQSMDVITLRNNDGRVGFGGDVITVKSGKVGIGYISPDASLTVSGSGAPVAKFYGIGSANNIVMGYNSSLAQHKIKWDSSKLYISADNENGQASSGLYLQVDNINLFEMTTTDIIVNSTHIDRNFVVYNDAVTAIHLDGTAQGAGTTQHSGRIGIMTANNANNAVVNIGGNANSYFGGGAIWGTAISHNISAHSSNAAGLYVQNTLTGGNSQTNPVLANAFFDTTTWTEGSSNTINLATNVYVAGAPTVTNHGGPSHALHVAAGTSYFGGNVGIGVTSPSAPLHIKTNQSDEYDTSAYISPSLYLENSNTSATSPHNLISFRIEKNGADGYLGFITDGSTANVQHFVLGGQGPGELFRITSAGNVGIGTTSPDTNLHIFKASAGTVTTDGNAQLTIENNDHASLQFLTPNNKQQQILFGDPDDIDIGYINYNHNTNVMSFAIAAGVRMSILSGGQVGIGTTSPSAKLEINTPDSSEAMRFGSDSHAWLLFTKGQQDHGGVITLQRENGSVNTSLNASPSFNSYINAQGANLGIGTASPGSTLHVHKASGPTYLRISDQTEANGLEFGYENGGYTEATIYNRYMSNNASKITLGFGTPSSGVETMTLLKSGNVGVGTNNPSAKLHIYGGNWDTQLTIQNDNGNNNGIRFMEDGGTINGYIYGRDTGIISFLDPNGNYAYRHTHQNSHGWYLDNSQLMALTTTGLGIGITSPSVALDVSGTIEATADVIAYASSDERLKENIKTIENPIEKVKQIRGVEFDWKEGNEDIHHNKGHDTGLIAQDVEKVVPEIVKDREDGYKGVRYEKLVGLLVESVKEQQKQIEELQSEIKELKDGSSK